MAKMNQQQNVEHKKSAERKAPRRQNVERLKRNILISLFAVIIAICSRITIPSAVPFTLQSLGVFLTFSLLGGKFGLASYLLYLSMGFLGIPVSASGQTGVAMLWVLQAVILSVGYFAACLFGFLRLCSAAD